jgi:hypothetical protein
LALALKIPKPCVTNKISNNVLDKIKLLISPTPNYNWESLTIDEFVTAICANNYTKLLDNKHIKSLYEIYVAVIGITVDKIGIDVFEITSDKSFTDDLGVS